MEESRSSDSWVFLMFYIASLELEYILYKLSLTSSFYLKHCQVCQIKRNSFIFLTYLYLYLQEITAFSQFKRKLPPVFPKNNLSKRSLHAHLCQVFQRTKNRKSKILSFDYSPNSYGQVLSDSYFSNAQHSARCIFECPRLNIKVLVYEDTAAESG